MLRQREIPLRQIKSTGPLVKPRPDRRRRTKGRRFYGVDSGRSPEIPHCRERGIGIEFDVLAVRIKSFGPRQPILDFEPGDTAKLAGVVRHQCETGGACVGGYEQVVRTDGRAFSLQVIADFRVMPFYR